MRRNTIYAFLLLTLLVVVGCRKKSVQTYYQPALRLDYVGKLTGVYHMTGYVQDTWYSSNHTDTTYPVEDTWKVQRIDDTTFYVDMASGAHVVFKYDSHDTTYKFFTFYSHYYSQYYHEEVDYYYRADSIQYVDWRSTHSAPVAYGRYLNSHK